jgi:hypothetical protein
VPTRPTAPVRRLPVLAAAAACLLAALPAAASAAVPASTSPPTVSGSPVVGSTLTASRGSWANAPTSYSYSWRRCDSAGGACAAIAGATAATYRVAAADAGHRLRILVKASNASGSASRRSAPTAVVTTPAATPTAPASTSAPLVTGTAQTGRTLTTGDGTWSGTTPMSFAYQWQDCDAAGAACAAITGATARTYTLRSSDEGHTLRAAVTAANSAGAATARSAQTGVAQPSPTPPPAGAGMRVSGNKLLNAAGGQVLFHGVNVSGTEYACIQGYGIFDGSSDDAAVAAIRSWNSNAVRVLLNEDCWLGINGVNPAYGGANYRQAIVDFVKRIEAHGMYAEVSLMWGAPGTTKATYQPAAPDADHSPTVWAQMAQTFKGDPGVVLAPWGETTVDANCFLNGGNCGADFNGTPYTSAGMQQAVDVMRANGWGGPIVIPGIDYANNLTQWLSHKPSDPLNQLMAEAHIYGKNTCGTTACMDSQYAPVAAQVPLILGEFGETYDDSSCGATNATAFMNWADAHAVGYEAWTWNTWGTCGSLISNEDGTPKGAYGSGVRSHFLARP